MGWSKLELVGSAFEQIGLAGYEFDLTGDEQNSALRVMDAMMAAWNRLGIRVGYALPSTPGASDINAQSGVTDDAFEAVYTNLAIRLAPVFGKTPSRETKQTAKAAYDVLAARAAAFPPQLQMPGTMPAGAGNRRYVGTCRPFLDRPRDPITTGPDGELEFN